MRRAAFKTDRELPSNRSKSNAVLPSVSQGGFEQICPLQRRTKAVVSIGMRARWPRPPESIELLEALGAILIARG